MVLLEMKKGRKIVICEQLIESISVNTVAHLKLHWALKTME